MKKAIGELKFPCAEKQTDGSEVSPCRSVDDFDAAQFTEFDNDDIVEPEEQWMGKNEQGISQSIVTLEKSKSRRAKFSILNAQNITICQNVPLLENGFTGGGTTTQNTCAFDSIFSIFACSYSDYSKFQVMVDQHYSSSELCGFIRKVMMQKKVSRQTYIARNKMLYGYAEQSGSKTKLTSLNCKTGIGSIFAKICRGNEVLASSILTRKCDNCEASFKLVRPFLPVITTNLDLTSLQNHIVDPTEQKESCPQCNCICRAEHQFSSLLALEVEPISAAGTKKYRVGDLSSQIKVNNKKWNLSGVVEGIGGHFICHALRKNNVWETYDDLAVNVAQMDTSRKLTVFMMFYLCSGSSTFIFILKLFLNFCYVLITDDSANSFEYDAGIETNSHDVHGLKHCYGKYVLNIYVFISNLCIHEIFFVNSLHLYFQFD